MITGEEPFHYLLILHYSSFFFLIPVLHLYSLFFYLLDFFPVIIQYKPLNHIFLKKWNWHTWKGVEKTERKSGKDKHGGSGGKCFRGSDKGCESSSWWPFRGSRQTWGKKKLMSRQREFLTAYEVQARCLWLLRSKRSSVQQWVQHLVPRWWPPCCEDRSFSLLCSVLHDYDRFYSNDSSEGEEHSMLMSIKQFSTLRFLRKSSTEPQWPFMSTALTAHHHSFKTGRQSYGCFQILYKLLLIPSLFPHLYNVVWRISVLWTVRHFTFGANSFIDFSVLLHPLLSGNTWLFNLFCKYC